MIPDPKPRTTLEQAGLEEAVLKDDEAAAAAAEPLRARLSHALAPVVAPEAFTTGGFGAGDVASGDGLLSWNKVAGALRAATCTGG
eukprot:2265306-Prymnesium_polylepis.2